MTLRLLALGIALQPWPACRAEQGVLAVSVRSPAQEILANVRIGTLGDGSTEVTDASGRARIRLAKDTRAGARVQIQIVPPPDLAMISPWGGEAIVPSFDNDSGNFVSVIAMSRRDVNALQNGSVLASLIQASRPQGPAASAVPASAPAGAKARKASFRAGTARGGPIPLAATASVTDRRLPALRVAEASAKDAAHADTGGLVTEAAASSVGVRKADVDDALAGWEADALTWKIVILTALFEIGPRDPFTALLASGDGDAIYGVGQFRIQTGAMQQLLRDCRKRDAPRFDAIMGEGLPEAMRWLNAPAEEGKKLMAMALLQTADDVPRHRTKAAWNARFALLGGYVPFQHVQMQMMQPSVGLARALFVESGLRSERALAFIYDSVVFHGPANTRVGRLPALRAAFVAGVGRPPDEQETLLMLTNSLSRGPYSDELKRFVRRRHLTIALGGGTMGTTQVAVDASGIGMRDVDTDRPIALSGDAVALKRLLDGWIPGDGKPSGSSY